MGTCTHAADVSAEASSMHCKAVSTTGVGVELPFTILLLLFCHTAAA
jgi:hypothetical protein